MNFRVENLDALPAALREDYNYGYFAGITAPEGNRIELREPPKAG